MKVCTRCKCDKEDCEFRIKFSKYKGKKYEMLNSTCKSCDNLIASDYYQKNKNDPEFKRKNAERVRAYANKEIDKIKARKSTEEYRKQHAKWAINRYHLKKDEINAKQREKRNTPEYKAYVNEYRQKNKDKIFQQERLIKEAFYKKHRDSVSDAYCISKLKEQKKITNDEITPELIEIKRIQILIKRLRNTIAKTKKNEVNKNNSAP